MYLSADVRSIAAVEDLRTALARYGSAVNDAMAELELEIRRSLDWVEHDSLQAWKLEHERRSRKVERATAELASARIAAYDERAPAITDHRVALRRAKERLEEAEEKIKTVRRWTRKVHEEVDDFRGPQQQFAELAATTIPAGLAELERMIAALQAYVDTPVADRPVEAQPPATLAPAQPQPSASQEVSDDEGETS